MHILILFPSLILGTVNSLETQIENKFTTWTFVVLIQIKVASKLLSEAFAHIETNTVGTLVYFAALRVCGLKVNLKEICLILF